MRRNIFVMVFLTIMFVWLFTGCEIGNRNVTSQERATDGFNAVTFEGVGNVIIHPGENYRVVVRTDSNLQDRVLITVNGNALRISQKPGSFNPTELTIDIYMPELNNISLNGVGNIKVNNGNVSKLDISISGKGNIDAQNFQVQNITIKHSGVGNARIWAVVAVDGNLTGVGNILYKGNPTININRTGVGNIKPL